MKKIFYSDSSRLILRLLSLVLFLCAAGLSACDDENEANEEKAIFEKLQGTWKSTYIVMHDNFTSINGETYNESIDEAITSKENEWYIRWKFDRNRKVTILESGSSDDIQLPATFGFTLSGNRISGIPFSGDFTSYSTITEISDTQFIIEMEDKGRDKDGKSDYYHRITFEKVQ